MAGGYKNRLGLSSLPKYVRVSLDSPIFTAYLPFASKATWTFLVLLELLRGALTCLSSAWGQGGGEEIRLAILLGKS